MPGERAAARPPPPAVRRIRGRRAPRRPRSRSAGRAHRSAASPPCPPAPRSAPARKRADRVPAYVLVLIGGLGGKEDSPLTGGLDQLTGFVVDEVLGVLGCAELPAAGDGPPRALPAYVVDVLRLGGGPLFVVDIGRMV